MRLGGQPISEHQHIYTMEQTPPTTPSTNEPNPSTTELTWAQAEQQLLAQYGGKSASGEKLKSAEQNDSPTTKTVKFVMIPRR